MKVDFDFQKIKKNDDIVVQKNELVKFLNFYFLNGRPKSFVRYTYELFELVPKMMDRLKLNELLSIIPNLYQFFYTITINEFYAQNQKIIYNKLLIPFSKNLQNSLAQSNFSELTYELNQNHYVLVCRHAVTQGMYAPGTVIYSLTSALLNIKKNVILVTLGEVDNKFLNLQKNNSNLSIMKSDKDTTPVKQLINLTQICKIFRPGKIITEMPVNIVSALYYINISSKILYWSPGFTEVPWYNKIMLIPELASKDKLKNKKNILIPRSIDFNLLNPPINEKIAEDFKRKNKIIKINYILGTFARFDKITIKFLKLVSFLLEQNKQRKIIIAGSNDNTEAKQFLKKFVYNKQAIILGQSNVHILGNICDVFLDTIPFPCGSSALEMMAKGKPVIGIKSDNLANYKKSRINNLIVENIDLLNNLLIKLENNEDFYNKMSKQSIKIARSWDKGKELVKIIEEI